MGAVFRQLCRGRFGLQFRTTLLLTCVVLAAAGLTGMMCFRMSARRSLAETKQHARDMAKALAAATGDAVERADRRSLLGVAESLAQNSDVSYAVFTDMMGGLLASYQRGAGHVTHLVLEDTRLFSVEPIDQPSLSVRGGGSPRIDIVYPVTSPRVVAVDDISPPTVGYVRLGISLAAAEARLDAAMRNIIGLAVGITLLMVPLGYEVVRHLVGPIDRLSRAARSFAAGNLDTRVAVTRRDELGELTGAFNSMADEVSRSHSQMVELNAELEDRVLQRTRDLERANDRLREMAVRDSLTGLYNRRHFSELLERLFAEAARYGTDITCVMLDLDNFKRVNDSLGHHVGDRLLQLTARVIRESVRESDVPVRFGGDEFVVVLPRTSPAEARASAERMLTNFRVALTEEMPEARIASLSIGLASREEDRPSKAMELVTLADEALYLAKAGGKNRIKVIRPAVAQPK
ncbi:MAG: diguanylate cyclase [Phycisphaerae bacterium]|nr:diguanylate cyclase [Phycisphaerae bacterium]